MIDLNLLKRLCLATGISGDEENIRKIILSQIEGYVEEVNIDNLGNILALKKGKSKPSKKLMISAHMDEVGLIATYITEEGYIGFSAVGGIDEKILLGKTVLIGERKISGVIGVKPVHLLTAEEKLSAIKIDDLYIDIGAKNKDQTLRYVSLGDFICFGSDFKVNGDIIMAKALDDRIGCMILIDLIKSELPFDVYFSFVVQEEIGLRGSTVASYKVAPDSAIVVETTTAADIHGNDDKVCSIGGGPVVPFMDRATVYDRDYYKIAFDLAKKHGLKIQTKTAIAGANDAGAIHKSRGGVKTIAISVPCRYLHSAYSLANIEDIENAEKLVLKLIGSIF
ncbi:MAG: M42 family peptidase [Clostridia bacterium]|nr:M42 family peptidase [Clostridia bacterium]